MRFERIAITDIAVPERLRAVEEEHAIAIAQSIVEHGLINPITVRATPAAKGGKYTLVAGAHRLRATVLNDDDVWLPEKLERQVALLDAHEEVGLVHTGGYFIDGEGKRTEGNPLGFRFPTFETGDILRGLVYENKIIASAALMRRVCFERVGPFNPSYFGSGDWEMWWRICERYAAGFVDEPLTLYRVHGANASHKLNARIRHDRSSGATLSRFHKADSAAMAANNAPPATRRSRSSNPSTRIEMSLNRPPVLRPAQ